MELRHWIAVGIVAVVVIAASTAGVVAMQRRKRRKLRLRGIKTYEHQAIRAARTRTTA